MIFISLDYSPWSEKARWALDWNGLNYENKAYVSMIGTPWLRYKTKKLTGPVGVPVLMDGKKALTDSFDIALFADNKSTRQDKQTLFPCEKVAKEWNELSETALSIGRYACVEKQLDNKAAQIEILPTFIPKAVKPYFTWLARNGLQYHLDKYPAPENSNATYRGILDKLREALAGKDYILDEFSYCDIVMALALQYVKPIESKYSAPGPAVAECWTNQALCEEYSDLIQWRDRLYEKHR